MKFEQDSLFFLNFLNNKHLNIKFTIEKQVNHSIAFFDAFITGVDNQNFTLQPYHISTYTGFILNFKSFTSFSYKISLITQCLLDRATERSPHKLAQWIITLSKGFTRKSIEKISSRPVRANVYLVRTSYVQARSR